jgi:hypothetical protein
VFLIIAHWIACIFYSVGQSEYLNQYTCWFSSLSTQQFEIGLQDQDNYTQYITSLYWSFVTMAIVGYGDITPITDNEKVFGLIAELIACGVFAYVVGSIEMIVNRSSTIEDEFKEKIFQVN